jgi:hypothetical protein
VWNETARNASPKELACLGKRGYKWAIQKKENLQPGHSLSLHHIIFIGTRRKKNMTQDTERNNTLSIIAALVGGYLAIGLVFVFILYTICGNYQLFRMDSNKYLSALNIMLYWPYYLYRMGIHWRCWGYS